MQSVMVEDDLQVVFEKLMKEVVEAKRKMERIFIWIRLQNKEHSDVRSGIRPTFSAFDFTAMLKDPRYRKTNEPGRRKLQKQCPNHQGVVEAIQSRNAHPAGPVEHSLPGLEAEGPELEGGLA